jgi:hypothetical protein
VLHLEGNESGANERELQLRHSKLMATRVHIYRGTTKEVNRKLLAAIVTMEAIIIAIVWFARDDLSPTGSGLPSPSQKAPAQSGAAQSPSKPGAFSTPTPPASVAERWQG